MRRIVTGLVLVWAMTVARVEAAPIYIAFTFSNGVTTLATGSFVFDSARDGSVIGFEDLTAFDINVLGTTYDLAFVNSGNFSEYRYLGFDSQLDQFRTTNINGFYPALSAIKNGFGIGFFIADLPNIARVVSEYSTGRLDHEWTVVTVRRTAVPEPAIVVLLGLGTAGAIRRRRSRSLRRLAWSARAR